MPRHHVLDVQNRADLLRYQFAIAVGDALRLIDGDADEAGCPPPFTSTSTSSRPSDCATRCATSSIFDATASRIVAKFAEANKKVGFRPLRWLDNSNPIVQGLARTGKDISER